MEAKGKAQRELGRAEEKAAKREKVLKEGYVATEGERRGEMRIEP